MAKKEINGPISDLTLNYINNNFTELYGIKKFVDRMVIESGNANAEVTQSRGGYYTLNDRLNIISSIAGEALGKAGDPLAAISASGYKISMDDLSTDVKSAMAGNAPITEARGFFENNRGAMFPLRNASRDGQLHSVSDNVKDAVLAAKVTNARKDKIYTIAYISKGVSDSYGVNIFEYDKSSFGTDSAMSERRLVYYNRPQFKSPLTGIQNLVIEDEIGEGLTFYLTIDYAAISGTNLNISNTANGQGYGCIIDESNYIYRASNYTEQQAINSLPLVCERVSGFNINIKFAYSANQNMIINFGELGINKIIHLNEIYLQDRDTASLGADFENKTVLYRATSDWISPHRIRAINNGNSNGYLTTGGNHGTDGGGGYPTAEKATAVGVYADNNEVRNGDVVYVKDNIVIQTTNYVCGMNTVDLNSGNRRDILKEVVTYTITPKNIAVTVEFEALEDIEIRDYSGLQAQQGAWNGSLYYMEDTGKPVKFDISGSESGDSSTKVNGNPDRWVMKKGSDVVVAYYDTSVGIGDREYVGTDQNLFWHSGTKVYGKLIYDGSNYIRLNQGDSFYWSGGYSFTRGFACPGAETAYSYYLSGKKVYVVDFFDATNTHLIVDRDDFNKRITVIEKSDSITCDNFISSNGLKIRATGYGQLKFTVD
ncbi:hypothetical protein [Oceanobacillus sojae]|uniref:hypothetical protein n=1 Tax=Oceanobacillus sojae TaxID=582851 RepID=UPI0036305EA2